MIIMFCYITEHISSIIGSMLRNCQSTQRQRLFNKFIENDHEKVSLQPIALLDTCSDMVYKFNL
jgi:hypothetical protein